MAKKKPLELTNEERLLFFEMSDFYLQHKLDKDSDSIGCYMAYAKHIGEIADVGDKYTDNIRFFEVKNKIRNYLSERKQAVYDLRKKLLN